MISGYGHNVTSPLMVVAITIMAFAAPASAAAQDDGWDVEVDPSGEITLAAVRYDTGQGVIAQCRDGELSTVLVGLPATASPIAPLNGITTRRLETGPPTALAIGYWRSAPDGTSAMRPGDARGVRALKQTGRYTVRTLASDNEPARRVVFDLPTDPSGVDQVLAACDRALVDPRDQLRDVSDLVKVDQRHRGLDAGHLGIRSYSFEYSCVVAPAGRVRDCVIESEWPPGRGIGERLLRSEPRARFDFGEHPENLVGGIFYISLSVETREEIIRSQ